jgi:nucleoside-diphosphate-sugar epimerase
MLQQRGHEVVGFDSDLFSKSTFGADPGIYKTPWIRKDIRDAEQEDVRGFDAILHLAGLSNDPLGDFRPEVTYDINHKASVKLAELAKKAGVGRFIFSSSCSNYGAAGDAPVDESSKFNPVTPYGESKVLVERDVSTMASGAFTPVFLRNATAYGVSSRLRFDLVVNNLTAWAFTKGQVRMKSDGMPWRPLVHIEDISRAFVATLEAPKEMVHNEAFNVGATKENYRVREVALIVKDAIPSAEVTFAEGAAPDLRNYRANCDKYCTRFPQWAPKWTVPMAVAELRESFTRNHVTVEDFEGARYKRIGQLQQQLADGVLDGTFRFQK